MHATVPNAMRGTAVIAGQRPRMAVVGHVEWIEFARVERVPHPGEIVTATESWEEPAGGGAVAAVELARLAGACTFFTALGDDRLGRRAYDELRGVGLRLEAVMRPAPQRRGFTFLDADGERTITVIDEKMHPDRGEPLPWDELSQFDGVYFTAGTAGALRAARRARVLVATARELRTLREAGVELDALVGSARDASEIYRDGDLQPGPKLVVRTEGSSGGHAEPGGLRWEAAPLPGRLADAYGAGDCFAAGLTFGLAQGLDPGAALALAAERAALALTRVGAHGR